MTAVSPAVPPASVEARLLLPSIPVLTRPEK